MPRRPRAGSRWRRHALTTRGAPCRRPSTSGRWRRRGRWGGHPPLTLFGPDLGEVDVDVADGIVLECPPLWPVAVDLGEPADPVALKAAVEAGPGEVRDRRLERGWAGAGPRQSSSGSSVWRRNATAVASSSAERTVECGRFGPIGASSTVARLRHFATVLRSIPWRVARAATVCWLRWMARRTAGVVRAEPWRVWPIAGRSRRAAKVGHDSLGLYT